MKKLLFIIPLLLLMQCKEKPEDVGRKDWPVNTSVELYGYTVHRVLGVGGIDADQVTNVFYTGEYLGMYVERADRELVHMKNFKFEIFDVNAVERLLTVQPRISNIYEMVDSWRNITIVNIGDIKPPFSVVVLDSLSSPPIHAFTIK